MDSSSTQRGRQIELAAQFCLLKSNHDHQCSNPLKDDLDANFSEDGPYGDEEKDVKDRLMALRRLFPGDEEMPVDQLLEKTANYIKALEGKVGSMRELVIFLDGLEKQKRMMGGGGISHL